MSRMPEKNQRSAAQPEDALRIVTAAPSDLDAFRDIDDDAAALFAGHGLQLDLAPEHPFAVSEVERWRRAAKLGRAFIALEASTAVGFASLDLLDGQPYLDELAVRMTAMRRGVGSRLMARAYDWARAVDGSALWLTTYAHLPFNQPYYERHGFLVVPESALGPDIRHRLEEQRRYLPLPQQRVAMRRAV
jgi:GNAT superfamily N-acetyltransferase